MRASVLGSRTFDGPPAGPARPLGLSGRGLSFPRRRLPRLAGSGRPRGGRFAGRGLGSSCVRRAFGPRLRGGLGSRRRRRPEFLGGGIFHDQLVAVAAYGRVLEVGQGGRLAGVVGFAGQRDVHVEHAAVELLHQADGLVGAQVEGLELRGHLGEDGFERGEGVALLEVAFTAAALLARPRADSRGGRSPAGPGRGRPCPGRLSCS